MAGLMVQRLAGGGVRIVSGTAKTQAVRALTLGVSGRSGETRPGAGLSLAGIIRGIGKVGTGFLSGGPIGAIGATAGLFAPGMKPSAPAGCPPGFRRNPGSGVCEQTGFVGATQRFFPGGQTGTVSDVGGEAVMGAFGLPARVPRQVGSITRNDGTVGPVLRCIAGMVLGKDNLCYPSQVLSPRSRFRKHKRPRKPPVTARDNAAIKRAAGAKERVKNLAKEVGLTVGTKAKSSSKSKAKGGLDAEHLSMLLALKNS